MSNPGPVLFGRKLLELWNLTSDDGCEWMRHRETQQQLRDVGSLFKLCAFNLAMLSLHLLALLGGLVADRGMRFPPSSPRSFNVPGERAHDRRFRIFSDNHQ